MGKVTYALLLIFAIEMALFLFGGQTVESTSLFAFLINPNLSSLSSIFLGIQSALLLVGGGILIVGTFFTINVYGIYAGLAAVFLTFLARIGAFWAFINSQLQQSSLVSSQATSVIATIICAPILIAYMIMMLDYIRGTE